MNQLFTPFKWTIPVLLAAGVSSCSTGPSYHSSTPVAASFAAPPMTLQQSLYEWYDDGGPGKVTVQISLASQMATFMRGDREIGWSYVTTGRAGQHTPTGTFTIQEKTVDKYSNRWGHVEDAYGNTVESSARHNDPLPAGERWVAAPMPYWMRLTSTGIGMHAGPIPDPGSPVSAGCIRLPKTLAPKLFRVVNIGTSVTISH